MTSALSFAGLLMVSASTPLEPSTSSQLEHEASAPLRRVVVMRWTASSGATTPNLSYLDEKLAWAVQKALPEADVIGMADLEALLDLEMAKDAIGCDDVRCTADIGLALDADLLIQGALGRVGQRLFLVLKAIDARMATVRARAEIEIRDDSIESSLIQRLAWHLLNDASCIPADNDPLVKVRTLKTGRVTQKWVTIEPEAPLPSVQHTARFAAFACNERRQP